MYWQDSLHMCFEFFLLCAVVRPGMFHTQNQNLIAMSDSLCGSIDLTSCAEAFFITLLKFCVLS